MYIQLLDSFNYVISPLDNYLLFVDIFLGVIIFIIVSYKIYGFIKFIGYHSKKRKR